MTMVEIDEMRCDGVNKIVTVTITFILQHS